MTGLALLVLNAAVLALLYLWYIEHTKKKHLQQQVRFWKKTAHRSPAGERLLFPHCKIYDQNDQLLEEAVDIFKVVNQDDTIAIILKPSSPPPPN